MKMPYDQLALYSGDKIGSLDKATEAIKAEMTPEVRKYGKCKSRVKSLEEDKRSLCEEIKINS